MLTPEKVQKLLSDWFVTKKTDKVEFREEKQPKNDSQDDYLVAYEAVFEPRALDQARIEIWVTPDGHIAIGVERWRRIKERLHIKCWSDRFASGCEPQCMSETELLAYLNLIAEGEIAISSTVIPLFGLISTRLVVSNDAFNKFVIKGHSSINWLKVVSSKRFSKVLLHFHKWE
ncbi:MAG: hypothetical protein KZQ74_01460 [gamma proteobacterium symbiont of Bathyaustriella thionipta]|nr:hypothetical protein [gamma proteobacterium symbiont of Bathyaustriella thionipta]